METTGNSPKRPRRRLWLLLGLPPAGCLLLIAALVGVSFVAPGVFDGDIDIRLPLGFGPGSPTFSVAANLGGSGNGKGKITLGLGLNAPAMTPAVVPPPIEPTADFAGSDGAADVEIAGETGGPSA